MGNQNFIQVFEYQKLKIGDGDFKENHLNSLVKFNEKNGNKYFTPVYNGVLFNSHVGIIQVDKLTIEILPKADKDSSNSENKKSLWQGVLLNMLKVCKKIQIDNVSETGLKKKNNSILEVYYDVFLNEIDHLIKNGLVKKYRRVEENQLALRGKLVFSQDLRKNIIHKERFFCEHQVYDKDHILHQIIFQALKILDNLVSNTLKDKVKRLLFELGDFKSTELNSTHFDKIKLDRKSQAYKKSLDIAKMLILNYSPNLSRGQEQMLTLLFDMNKLWEEFIYRVLQKYSDSKKYELSSQEQDKFWEHKTIRPDIVIRDVRNNETFIIDTKWKIVENNNPGDDDLKQIFAYNLHWKSSKALLLYPKIDQSDSSFGKYHHKPYYYIGENINQFQNSCKVGFISIIENDTIRDLDKLHLEIISKLY